MNPFRHFKTMTPEAMIELLPETDIDGTNTTLCVLGLSRDLPENYFEGLVKKGKISSTCVHVDGKPFYRLIWEKLNPTTLSILLAQGLKVPADIRYFGKAIDSLALQQNVRRVLFSTARRALVEQAKTWGASPFQVWMEKNYV